MCAETPKQPKKGERAEGGRTDGLLQESERRKREREGEKRRGGRWSEVEVRCGGGGGWSFHSIVQLPDRPDGGGFHQRSRANRSLLREGEPSVCDRSRWRWRREGGSALRTTVLGAHSVNCSAGGKGRRALGRGPLPPSPPPPSPLMHQRVGELCAAAVAAVADRPTDRRTDVEC